MKGVEFFILFHLIILFISKFAGLAVLLVFSFSCFTLFAYCNHFFSHNHSKFVIKKQHEKEGKKILSFSTFTHRKTEMEIEKKNNKIKQIINHTHT